MRNVAFPHLFLMAVVLLPSSVLGWRSILSRSGSRTTPRNRFFLGPRTKQIPFVVRMMARDGPIVRVSLQKPLGIQLEEIEAGAPGVRVAGLVEGGTAIKSGEISASMVLVELGGRDVTGATFDDVMEALVAAPAGIPIELTFRDPSSSSSSSSLPPPVSREACSIRVVGADGGTIAVVKARTGDNLRSALLADKVDLYDMFGKVSNCNGGGQCGTCVVQVEDADGWDERSDWEAGKLKGRPESQRLACQTVIQGDATVMTKPPKRA